MRLSEMLIIVFLIAIFATGFVGFYGAVMTSENLEYSNFSYANNTSSTLTTIEKMYNRTESAQGESGAGNGLISLAPINLLLGAYDAIMMTFQLPNLFTSMIADMTSQVFGFPTYVGYYLSAIIMIIFISALIYLIIGKVF